MASALKARWCPPTRSVAVDRRGRHSGPRRTQVRRRLRSDASRQRPSAWPCPKRARQGLSGQHPQLARDRERPLRRRVGCRHLLPAVRHGNDLPHPGGRAHDGVRRIWPPVQQRCAALGPRHRVALVADARWSMGTASTAARVRSRSPALSLQAAAMRLFSTSSASRTRANESRRPVPAPCFRDRGSQ